MKFSLYAIITLFSLSFWSISVKSQISQRDFRIGFSGGIEKNVSSNRMAFGDFVGYTADYNKLNYRLGLDFEYGLKNNLTIVTSINYSNKDFTGTYFCDVCDFEFPPEPENVKFAFIEVPISLKHYFWKNKIHPFVEAGLNNLFALNKLDYEARTNSYTIGIKVGVGLELSLGQKTSLQLKIDYNNTFSKLFQDSYFEDPDFMLRTLGIGIGLMKKI